MGAYDQLLLRRQCLRLCALVICLSQSVLSRSPVVLLLYLPDVHCTFRHAAFRICIHRRKPTIANSLLLAGWDILQDSWFEGCAWRAACESTHFRRGAINANTLIARNVIVPTHAALGIQFQPFRVFTSLPDSSRDPAAFRTSGGASEHLARWRDLKPRCQNAPERNLHNRRWGNRVGEIPAVATECAVGRTTQACR